MVLGFLVVGAGAVSAEVAETEEPTTEETIGYVDGYWYDDELAVDDREEPTLDEAELEAAVARSMARVEVIRNLTFEESVPVEVITREEFQDDVDEIYNVTPEQERHYDVLYEGLYMVDAETDAWAELEAVIANAVGGYYEPEADRIVLVSDTPAEPEVDEITLGHELLHALQDQHFDLESVERESIDQSTAADGLIEGDAVLVETEYEERCTGEWSCLPTPDVQLDPPDINQGLLFMLIQPYIDGPAYVDQIQERDGWAGVDEQYDDIPQYTSEIIRPDERPTIRGIAMTDRSTAAWEPLEADTGNEWNSLGEVGLATMFMYRSMQGLDADGVGDGVDSFSGEITYDHRVTDGWAGDRFVGYSNDDGETGYVWETAWADEDEAIEFLEGYLAVLEHLEASPVDDHADTYRLEGDFPGAVYLERSEETVRIVNAPTVEALSTVDETAAPSGEDQIDLEPATVQDDDDADGLIDEIPGPGPAVVGALVAVVGLLLVRRSQNQQ